MMGLISVTCQILIHEYTVGIYTRANKKIFTMYVSACVTTWCAWENKWIDHPLSLSFFFFSFSLFLYEMLSLRALNQVRTGIIKNTKPAITTLFKSHYHSFHEDNASVIPNIVETASASFKVKKKERK